MKKHTIKFKQENILCYRCIANVAEALKQIKDIQEISIDIKSKIIKITYIGAKISKEIIKIIANDSIINGKTKLIPQYLIN